MGRRPKQVDPNPVQFFPLSFDPETAQEIAAYHVLHGQGYPIIETVRTLVKVALAITPQSGAADVAAHRAFTKISAWGHRELDLHLAEMRAQLATVIAEEDEVAERAAPARPVSPPSDGVEHGNQG
jgi:hypothetical protein